MTVFVVMAILLTAWWHPRGPYSLNRLEEGTALRSLGQMMTGPASQTYDLHQGSVSLNPAEDAQILAAVRGVTSRPDFGPQRQHTLGFYYHVNSEGGEVVQTLDGHNVLVRLTRNRSDARKLAKLEAESLSIVYHQPVVRLRYAGRDGDPGYGVIVSEWDGLWGRNKTSPRRIDEGIDRNLRTLVTWVNNRRLGDVH